MSLVAPDWDTARRAAFDSGRPLGTERLPAGAAVEIATGAEVPKGIRGVLRGEHGRLCSDGLLRADQHPGGDGRSCAEVAAGQDIRPAAEEAAGTMLVCAGTRLAPVHLGITAAAGLDALVVVRRPTARLLVCGDELPRSGPARDGRVPAIQTAGDVDLVVTTGGTAVGPADHLHATVSGTDGTLVVDSVAVRPGHPMLLGGWGGGRWLLGLPGKMLRGLGLADGFTVVPPAGSGGAVRWLPLPGREPQQGFSQPGLA